MFKCLRLASNGVFDDSNSIQIICVPNLTFNGTTIFFFSYSMNFARFPPLVTRFFCHHNACTAASDVTVTSTPNWSMLHQTVLNTTFLSHHRPFILPLCVRGTMRAEMLSHWSSQFCFTGKFRVCVCPHS